MSHHLGDGPDEITVNVSKQDFDTMLPYIMKMLAEGFKLIKITEDTFMIKYCGYSLINITKKEIKSVVKKPDY